MQALLCGRQP